MLEPSSVISVDEGAVFLSSVAVGLAETAILCSGVIDSNNAVFVNGTMEGSSAVAVTFSGAQFPGVGAVSSTGIGMPPRQPVPLVQA